MDIDFAVWMVAADQDHGGVESSAELMEGYSGRGMHGEETAAVTTDSLASLLLFCVEAAKDAPDDVPEVPYSLRTDDMAQGKVIY